MCAAQIHIGHHFFGAGNFGDDLMLAGFLAAAKRLGFNGGLTCAIPFDRCSQERRFPKVQWLPYEPALREAAIQSCDVWLGLGDTPFQTDTGPWMLDHLMEELEMCRKHRKPMFFLGVGMNNWEAFQDPRARAVLEAASHVWTRDWQTAVHAVTVCGSGRVSAGADLANIFLQTQNFPPAADHSLGWVLNFEKPEQFDSVTFGVILENLREWRHAWLVQEARALPGAEKSLLAALSPASRESMELREADYKSVAVEEFCGAWQVPSVIVSSRYHGLLVGAWMGARLVGVTRNDKVNGLVSLLGIPRLENLLDAGSVVKAVGHSSKLDRSFLEAELAAPAFAHCREFFQRVAA